MRYGTVGALLLVAVLMLVGAGCSTTTGPSTQSAPGPCQDPTYSRLRAMDPDELSDREWQRLRELEAQCQQLRLSEARGRAGWGPGGTDGTARASGSA